MALIKRIGGHSPTWGEACWFAETATLVGNVIMGNKCTVWFNAVVRGDVNVIRIGDQTNIQDGVIIHGTYQKSGTYIGSNVSIAHGAIIHGCTIEDNVLVGMRAVIMDNAVVKEGAVIAAGAVVLAGTVVEADSIYAGMPAKKVKATGEFMKSEIERIAGSYPRYASWYEQDT